MDTPRHVPVLLDRVVALVAPALTAPGSVLVDATLGLGGHTEAVLERCPEARVVGIDRDTHALERSRARLAPYGERVTLVHAVYDEIGEVLDDLGLDARRRRALRPRRLLDAARRPRARLRLRRGRAARHADERHHRPHRRRRAQRVPRRGADPDPQAVRRGEVRAPHRRGDRPRAGARALHPVRPAGRAALRRDPGAGPAHRGTPGQADLPGAAHRGQRRAVGAAPGAAGGDRGGRRSAAAWSSCPTTRSRTGSPSRRSPR